MAYAMLLEDRKQDWQTDMMLSGFAAIMSSGKNKPEVFDPNLERTRWDEWLRSAPPKVDPDREVLLTALGLR